MHDHERPGDRLECPRCRAEAVRGAPDVDLTRVWTVVAATVLAPRIVVVERIAARLLPSPGLARALVTTPSLVLSWLIATAAVLVAGVAVSASVGAPLVPLLAPALAGAGIAFAYGPGTDPAAELAGTMPVSARMVLLVRSVAVFGVNAALGLIASLLAPAAAHVTWLWLVPMTAVSALCLAAATLAGSAAFGTLVGLAAWSIAVVATSSATVPDRIPGALLAHPMLLGYLVVAALGVVTVAISPSFPRVRKGLPL